MENQLLKIIYNSDNTIELKFLIGEYSSTTSNNAYISRILSVDEFKKFMIHIKDQVEIYDGKNL
tara:strand:- start:239 stop:430 length:192 start_codon:yes stop_codon:yes gene_type:complete